MTIALHAPLGRSAADGATWRALRRGLWVARLDGKHLGTIEHGRRWVATDADGEPIGAFRSFREAQAAVADPALHRVPVRPAATTGPALTVVGLGVAALLCAGWAWAGGWAWAALLF